MTHNRGGMMGRIGAWLPLALLAMGLASAARGQSANSTQQAMMNSMQNHMAVGGGTGVMSSAAANQQAMARNLAAMQSMQYNQAAQLRGLQQQAIYRTQDNLEGVYWHMYFADQARARSVYSHMGGGNMIPSPLVQQQAVVDWQRQQAIAVRNQLEYNRRLQQRNPSVAPNAPPSDVAPSFPGADMLGRGVALPQNAPRAAARGQPGPPRAVLVEAIAHDSGSQQTCRSCATRRFRRKDRRLHTTYDRPEADSPGRLSAEEPEGAVAADGLVGGQGEPGVGDDLGGVGDGAVVGVVVDAEQVEQAHIVPGKLPAVGQGGELGAEPGRLAQRSGPPAESGRVDGPDVRREEDAASLAPDGRDVRQLAAPSAATARSWNSPQLWPASSPKRRGATPSHSPSAPKAWSRSPATSRARRSSNIPFAPPTVTSESWVPLRLPSTTRTPRARCDLRGTSPRPGESGPGRSVYQNRAGAPRPTAPGRPAVVPGPPRVWASPAAPGSVRAWR